MKFISTFKVGFFLFILFLSANTYAEYYLVSGCRSSCYSGCNYPCVRSCYPCYQRLYSIAPYRHHYVGSGEMEEYEWVGDP